MGIVSLILGIIAIIIDIATLGTGGIVSVILGVIGIIFGALGRKKAEGQGIATAGLVLSILGVNFGLIVYIACVACVAGAASLV